MHILKEKRLFKSPLECAAFLDACMNLSSCYLPEKRWVEELAVPDQAKKKKKKVCNGLEITKIWIYRNCWFCFFLIFRKVFKKKKKPPKTQNKNPETYPRSKIDKSSIRS